MGDCHVEKNYDKNCENKNVNKREYENTSHVNTPQIQIQTAQPWKPATCRP